MAGKIRKRIEKNSGESCFNIYLWIKLRFNSLIALFKETFAVFSCQNMREKYQQFFTHTHDIATKFITASDKYIFSFRRKTYQVITTPHHSYVLEIHSVPHLSPNQIQTKKNFFSDIIVCIYLSPFICGTVSSITTIDNRDTGIYSWAGNFYTYMYKLEHFHSIFILYFITTLPWRRAVNLGYVTWKMTKNNNFICICTAQPQ